MNQVPFEVDFRQVFVRELAEAMDIKDRVVALLREIGTNIEVF
jgi:hypothetical protein